jgi:hypothetical protein
MRYVITVFDGAGVRLGFFNAARTKANAAASFLTTDGRRAKRFNRDTAHDRAGRFNAMNEGKRTAYAVPLSQEIEDAR